MNNTSAVDFIGLVVFLSAWVFNAEVAAVIGPYVAIIVAAACGAGLSLSTREKTTRPRAIGYFLTMCTLATIVAGSISAILAWMHSGLSERALLAPVALAIGWIGDDWSNLRLRFLDFLRDSVFRSNRPRRGDDQ